MKTVTELIEMETLLADKDAGIMNQEKDLTTLDAWKKSRFVKLFFYKKIIVLLPSEEKSNLSQQIRRAAISSTLNTAEGYGRYYYKESVKFYRISRGSLNELKDALITCLDLDNISKPLFTRVFYY